VTARQLEALVRLGEASARIRLSNTIEQADAERVIHIVDACLRQIAYDARTGSFDIDKVITGISKEKRDIVRVIKDAIRDIGGEGKRAAIDQVIDVASQKGFARDKVREGIDMLLRNGEAMEPKNGIIQLI
jgi:replicative DNA helicase Mcm